MEIKQRLEAMLLASNRPLKVLDFLELLDLEADDEARVVAALYELQNEYKDRSINLIEVSSGFRVQIDQAFSNDIAKLWEVKPLKLSKTTLETLSIIAYMQPVTRGDIEEIRGVAVATNVIKLLIDQGWIKIKGFRDVAGRPALFITTQKFLDDFSMKSISELPALPELPNIPNISPELSLTDEEAEQPAQDT
ncbi:MAG: SMC-Scp complex subunit ScpB [Proteobacteria bacterium]|uniref:SMC-Scp complex subunit ScpB n=1 Tax=SAR86 cluster bacterium TaxID=2030880 RepID=A0A937IAQ0_9GAMM|nr:SMC-Scp complex subunit ScpB [SAR86 cluster bacterium]MDA0344523.1 SMC-Scp complex subunit ScpB [Pseudomonadota bacterium]MDA0900041.1 SMC-Scp complex subunit ScpB [Pseudomonadota bacterium]MDA1056830.1 SMC-Scp complex subunit ScpB [Pseudomonadota bacterium]